MDKKKIRKLLTKGHKMAKPLTDRSSHKDIKHVSDAMTCICAALREAGPQEPDKFLAKAKLSRSNDKDHNWYSRQNGVDVAMTTSMIMGVITSAKKYLKENY